MTGIEIATGELMNIPLPWMFRRCSSKTVILLSGICSVGRSILAESSRSHQMHILSQLDSDAVPVLICKGDNYDELSGTLRYDNLLKIPESIKEKENFSKPHLKFTPKPWSFKRK